jgi:tetratricopeptide (TPR) repeat protein
MYLTRDLKPAAATILLGIASVLYAQDDFDENLPAPPPEQLVPVADDRVVGPEPGPEPTLSDHQRLIVEFERYKSLMGDGVLDEADTVAKRVVELAIRITGPDSNDTARALTNLAIVQHRTRQYDAAQQNFQAAVEIIESNEDRLNAQLVNPLRGLGAAQLEAGRPDLASRTFQRAVHVTHVNEGPHNLDQVGILDSLAEASLRLGSIDEAREIQDTIYALNARHYADNVPDLLPALMERASWQHRAGFIFDERTTYRRIIRIIEEQFSKDDLRLIDPLTKLGQSFFFVDLSGSDVTQSVTMTTGEMYFKRALRIAEENPGANWQDAANTTLALGDYYMYQGNEQRARKTYRDAWEMLSEDEDKLAYRRDALERFRSLREQPIPEFAGDRDAADGTLSDEAVKQGLISVSYAVSARGRATNLKVVEAQPPDFSDMLRNVQREMRLRIYRPQFEDGEPVVSADQILTHRFFYKQSDLDALRAEATDAEPNEES